MNVLVTGGAGYIGSHACKALAAGGINPVVLDDLSTGNRWAVKWGPFIKGDIADVALVRELLRAYSISSVLHFAGSGSVAESMENAAKYFNNNLRSGLALLEAMIEAGAKTIVFSSTCAVYGDSVEIPIAESTKTSPINPYGESKLMFEGCLRWYARVHGLRWLALRYFNAAGADPDGEIGEEHDPETHLVPCVIRTALGMQDCLTIYGSAYPTPDGTCVRDYVHVTDLARAHVRAMQHLWTMPHGYGDAVNLGTGQGHSVSEVVREVERVAGRRVNVSWAAPRPGDPPALVAAVGKAARDLGWVPALSSLESLVDTAHRWHSRSLALEPFGSDRNSPLVAETS